MAWLYSLFIFVIILFPSLSNGQLHIMRLVPMDTLFCGEDSLHNFKVVNYNNDEYPDYYVVSNRRAYLFNGESLELFWNGPRINNLNYQNLEYIESIEVWRNYLIERIDAETFEITWIDLPEQIPGGPIVGGTYIDIDDDWFANMYIGYIAFNNFETIFSQISLSETALEIGWSFGLGLTFGLGGYFINEFYCSRSLENKTFLYNDQIYLWHFGNLYEWWLDIFGDIQDRYWGQTIIYNSYFSEVMSYQSYNGLTKSCDFYSDDENIAPKQLLAGEYNIILYNDIFNDSTFLTYSSDYGISYPQFFIYDNELKILVGSMSGRFNMLDLDLSLFRPFPEQFPGGIQDIYAEDIDNDGTDEVFCIYGSYIIICEIEEGVGIDDPSAALPIFYITNHPNPFNASTSIQFNLPESGLVSIDIFNLLGQNVSRLIDSPLPAGNHQVTWNAADLPSGIYFYKIQAGEYRQTKKMMLLK